MSYISELIDTRFMLQDLKTVAGIAMRPLIQADLDSIEQLIQLTQPDEEMVRLSSSDESLNGYAFLPVEERTPVKIEKWFLIKNRSHGYLT